MTATRPHTLRPIAFYALLSLLLFAAGCGSPASRTDASVDAHESGHPEAPGAHEAEEGHVALSEEARGASGIEVAAAGPRRLSVTRELPGEVVPDANRLAHIVPRFPGIAHEIRKSLGEEVREGEVLAVIEGNQSLSTYEVRSLLSGTIIEKHITLGEFLRDDQDIYVVADLGTVWVDIAVYPRDLTVVEKGQPVTVRAIGEQFADHGRIDYIGSTVGEASRAATARVVLRNTGRRWRPGTFVTAEVVVSERTVPVAVPAAALQRIEGRDCVFVESAGGFEARPVTTGAHDAGWVEILTGLAEGERYVSSGSFVVRSELQKSEAGHSH